MDYLGTIRPGLIRYTDNDFFDYVPFDLSGEQSLEEQCAAYFSKYPDSELPETEPENNVLEKIQNNLQELKELGIYEIFLQEIGRVLNEESPTKPPTQPNKLSRLVIDEDYRIWLPDYDNKEIKMTPLPKALYLLFLRQSEGIFLKQIVDYKQVLIAIYKQISNRENYTDMTDSIEKMCNPLDNSINEKLSRIREAFVKNISEKYAEFYYVSGERGVMKRIKLDRELVEVHNHF